LVRETRPAAVIGLGGYLSVPTIWAAACEHVPILLLEQNAIPGRATSWLARLARLVCVSFEESLAGLPPSTPTLLSGTPLRDEVRVLADEPPRGSSSGPPTLLVLGGSQGAEGLNAAVSSLLQDQRAAFRHWRVIHQTGSRQQDDIRRQYAQTGHQAEVVDFLTDVAAAYRRADLVISRAGATTLSELTCAGRPMVLVPYPHATDQHQHANAAALVRHQAAICVEQAGTPQESATRLATAVLPLVADPSRREQLALAARGQAHPDATDRVCELLSCCLRSAA
jgi:UDP-N-acetylglucosamine--N-acetylmuramyl-(pentapeptide) pyrophosphoryl-undecaprenol N-acetylglucosamine transferase